MRDSTKREVPGENLVLGDIIELAVAFVLVLRGRGKVRQAGYVPQPPELLTPGKIDPFWGPYYEGPYHGGPPDRGRDPGWW